METIKTNLIKHITHSVQWTSMVNTMNTMNTIGVKSYYESGPDDTLQKIVKRMYPQKEIVALADIPMYKNLIINFKTV